jgi:hypothetical protein
VNKGGQWGVADVVRVWLTGGTGRNGAQGSEAGRQRALTGGPGSIVPAGSVLNLLKIFKHIQRYLNSSKVWLGQKIPSLAPKI